MSVVRGCSKCPSGAEQWSAYTSAITKKSYVQYDYRTEAGELFSVVAPTLQGARKLRDKWLAEKGVQVSAYSGAV